MKYKLACAAMAVITAMVLMFASLLFFVEGTLDVAAFAMVAVLAAPTIALCVILFFAGDDAFRLAKYNFFKQKGGGMIVSGYEDKTIDFGFSTRLPRRVEFDCKKGQDEKNWSEALKRPWHGRGTGVPWYFFFEGIPHNVDPFTNENLTDTTELLNKAIVLADMRGKIEAMRNLLKGIMSNPTFIGLLAGSIIAGGLAALMGYNCLQLLKALAVAQNINPSDYILLFG